MSGSARAGPGSEPQFGALHVCIMAATCALLGCGPRDCASSISTYCERPGARCNWLDYGTPPADPSGLTSFGTCGGYNTATGYGVGTEVVQYFNPFTNGLVAVVRHQAGDPPVQCLAGPRHFEEPSCP
jgi:hypothetical protein